VQVKSKSFCENLRASLLNFCIVGNMRQLLRRGLATERAVCKPLISYIAYISNITNNNNIKTRSERNNILKGLQ